MGLLDVAQMAGGLLLIAAGIVLLRFNRDVADVVLDTDRFQYDDRVTLYDLDRAARMRKLYDKVLPVDRARAAFVGLWLLVAGGSLFALGVS